MNIIEKRQENRIGYILCGNLVLTKKDEEKKEEKEEEEEVFHPVG